LEVARLLISRAKKGLLLAGTGQRELLVVEAVVHAAVPFLLQAELAKSANTTRRKLDFSKNRSDTTEGSDLYLHHRCNNIKYIMSLLWAK
jgi:hypothetical protein